MTNGEPYKARRLSANRYHLNWPATTGELRIIVTDSAEGVLNSEPVAEHFQDASTGEAVVELTDPTIGTVFFHLLTPSGAEHVITDRAIPAEGVNNFRDFGGYSTQDGRKVRWRTLFRSGHLGLLTDQDRQAISDLAIGTVFDFRTRQEVNAYPSRYGEHNTPQVIQLSINAGNVREILKAAIRPPDLPAARESIYRKMLEINHLLVSERTESYQRMFQGLLENRGSYLIHCSAGKDRTGLGAALILSALGVPRETIVHDYLLTNEFLDPKDTQVWFARFLTPDINIEAAAPLFSVHSEFLEQAFATIDRDYGGTSQYLRDMMNLDTDAITALKARFLI